MQVHLWLAMFRHRLRLPRDVRYRSPARTRGRSPSPDRHPDRTRLAKPKQGHGPVDYPRSCRCSTPHPIQLERPLWTRTPLDLPPQTDATTNRPTYDPKRDADHQESNPRRTRYTQPTLAPRTQNKTPQRQGNFPNPPFPTPRTRTRRLIPYPQGPTVDRAAQDGTDLLKENNHEYQNRYPRKIP